MLGSRRSVYVLCKRREHVSSPRAHVTRVGQSRKAQNRARGPRARFFLYTDGSVHAGGGRDERVSFYGPTVSTSLEEN
jgi:hypothetical protein